MGLLDGFTSDGTVNMKYTEFYKLMREAAKAELMENAARCNVPHEYVREMLTGKMEAPEILPEVEPHPDYEIESMITSARRFLRMLPDEERLEKGVETLKSIVELAERERLNEIILDNAEKLKAREAAGCITPGHKQDLINILYTKYETIRGLESWGAGCGL